MDYSKTQEYLIKHDDQKVQKITSDLVEFASFQVDLILDEQHTNNLPDVIQQ